MNEEQIRCSVGTVGRENKNTEKVGGKQDEWEEGRQTEEIWKDVVGYEGLYQVSNFGRAMNSKKELLNPWDQLGYKYIGLFKMGRPCVKKRVHALVLQSFVGESNGLICDHINGNKGDNRLSNLRYITNSHNNINRKCKGYCSNGCGGFVTKIVVNGKPIRLGTFHSEKEASEVYEKAKRKYYPDIYLVANVEGKK